MMTDTSNEYFITLFLCFSDTFSVSSPSILLNSVLHWSTLSLVSFLSVTEKINCKFLRFKLYNSDNSNANKIILYCYAF